MQRLVFLIESNQNDFGLASNVGNFYMNRFIIDEDAGHELVKICEIEGFHFRNAFETIEEKERMGMGHIRVTDTDNPYS